MIPKSTVIEMILVQYQDWYAEIEAMDEAGNFTRMDEKYGLPIASGVTRDNDYILIDGSAYMT